MKLKKFGFYFSALLVIAFLGFVMTNDPFGSKMKSTKDVNATNPVQYISPNSVIYTDDMDGDNSVTGLQARGYLVYNQSNPVGTTSWFQGNSSVFSAFNGPSTGYVGANFNATGSIGDIDLWLVFPKMPGGLISGDSLYFYQRSPDGDTYVDSIRVMYSANDSTPTGTWTELGRFITSVAGWQLKGFKAPTTNANGRFAIRYCVVGGGASGANSDYIGIDAVSIVRSGSPVSLHQADQFCSNYPSLPGSGALLYHASCVLGDTLYVAGGDGTGLPSTTFYKYAISSNTWTTGASMPGPKCGGDLCAANGKIFYMGGGSASNTAGTAEQFKYTPSTGSWTTIAPIPTPVTGNVAETYNDTIIYNMMGGWTSYLTTIQVYYVGSNTWTTATAFGGPGRRSFAGGILGNNIFVACGYNGAYLSSFYKGVINPASPLTITWSAVANNILWTASRAGGTAIAGRFYVSPGDTGTGTGSNRIGIFDTTAGTWSYVSGDPFVNSNYWGVMSASIVNNGVKVWRPGGSLSASTRPLVVFADTCVIITTGISNNNNTIPNNYSLKQNYPNPFNPITKISFEIPKSGLVTLKVYDVLGKEIATIVNEVKNPGSYLVDFNGSSLSSGVYFYKLESNGFSSVKKMMLIK